MRKEEPRPTVAGMLLRVSVRCCLTPPKKKGADDKTDSESGSKNGKGKKGGSDSRTDSNQREATFRLRPRSRGLWRQKEAINPVPTIIWELSRTFLVENY